MATVFECDRCKTLDRGPSQGSGRREIRLGPGDGKIVCHECAAEVEQFLASPMPEAKATCNAARAILARNLLGELHGEPWPSSRNIAPWWISKVEDALVKLGALPATVVRPSEVEDP